MNFQCIGEANNNIPVGSRVPGGVVVSAREYMDNKPSTHPIYNSAFDDYGSAFRWGNTLYIAFKTNSGNYSDIGANYVTFEMNNDH